MDASAVVALNGEQILEWMVLEGERNPPAEMLCADGRWDFQTHIDHIASASDMVLRGTRIGKDLETLVDTYYDSLECCCPVGELDEYFALSVAHVISEKVAELPQLPKVDMVVDEVVERNGTIYLSMAERH